MPLPDVISWNTVPRKAVGMTNQNQGIEILAKKSDCMFMRTRELGVLAFESLILVQILLQARNHSHLEQLAVTAMCWEKGSDRFWEPFRVDLTDYPPFL